MKNRPLLLFLITVAGIGLIWDLAPPPATDPDPDAARDQSHARGPRDNVAPGTRKSTTGDPSASSTESPAKVIGLVGDAWQPRSLQLSEVVTNERALEAVSAPEPKVAMVVTKHFLDTVVQQGGDTAGSGPDRDVLYEALAKGHVVFGVDCTLDDLAGALGLQDVVTPWDPEGSYFPLDDNFLDPASVSPGVAVWFTDDEGWISYRISEARQPTRQGKDRAGILHVFDPNVPSYDFVAPMLSSIVRNLNADGTSKATAAP